ncbi:hypothetical protein ACIQNK_28020 [Streptomyces sp. NPDC091273]|uniref:hypothetical protein n=1 Tax=Streptomyces sp. NPDC091273 TaxID=3365982 RepID=UPI0038011062
MEGREVLKGSSGSNVRNPKPAAGKYTSDSPTGTSTLVISAMYGRFKDIGGVSLAVPAREPLCAWANGNTGASAGAITPGSHSWSADHRDGR